MFVQVHGLIRGVIHWVGQNVPFLLQSRTTGIGVCANLFIARTKKNTKSQE